MTQQTELFFSFEGTYSFENSSCEQRMQPSTRLLHFDVLHAIKARWHATEDHFQTHQENRHRLAGYVGYSEKGVGYGHLCAGDRRYRRHYFQISVAIVLAVR
jgi:hypothetical protein